MSVVQKNAIVNQMLITFVDENASFYKDLHLGKLVYDYVVANQVAPFSQFGEELVNLAQAKMPTFNVSYKSVDNALTAYCDANNLSKPVYKNTSAPKRKIALKVKNSTKSSQSRLTSRQINDFISSARGLTPKKRLDIIAALSV